MALANYVGNRTIVFGLACTAVGLILALGFNKKKLGSRMAIAGLTVAATAFLASKCCYKEKVKLRSDFFDRAAEEGVNERS